MNNTHKVWMMLTLLTTLASSTSIFSGMTAEVINFELYNKENQPVTVDLNGKKHTVSPGKTQTLQLTVQPTQALSIKISSNTAGVEQFEIKPSSTRKTVFLSWNPGDKSKPSPLYPQTGPWMGWKGTTESGLVLDKKTNVTANEISGGTQTTKNNFMLRNTSSRNMGFSLGKPSDAQKVGMSPGNIQSMHTDNSGTVYLTVLPQLMTANWLYDEDVLKNQGKSFKINAQGKNVGLTWSFDASGHFTLTPATDMPNNISTSDIQTTTYPY